MRAIRNFFLSSKERGRRESAALFSRSQVASRPAARRLASSSLNLVTTSVASVASATAAAGVIVAAGPVGPVGPTGPTGPEATVTPAAAVADATDTTDVVTQFNELLANLRAAGLLET